MSLDGHELVGLARDLGKLAGGPLVIGNVTKVVEQGSARVAKSWNGKLYRDGHARLTGGSITADVAVASRAHFDLFQTDAVSRMDDATIVGEIGAKRGNHRQAGVVRLIENGSATNAPHGYGAAALHEEEGSFDAAIGLAVWAAEREAGL